MPRNFYPPDALVVVLGDTIRYWSRAEQAEAEAARLAEIKAAARRRPVVVLGQGRDTYRCPSLVRLVAHVFRRLTRGRA